MKKTCSKCGIKKGFSDFYKDKNKKNNISPECKLCKNKYNQDNKEIIKIRKKERYERNKDIVIAKQKIYNSEHKNEFKATEKNGCRDSQVWRE